jgi:hypothetical protein
MSVYAFNTRLSPQEVVKKATDYFAGKLGLQITEQTECCVSFTGGGGTVTVSANAGAKRTEVEVRALEWEFQARKFMRQFA